MGSDLRVCSARNLLIMLTASCFTRVRLVGRDLDPGDLCPDPYVGVPHVVQANAARVLRGMSPLRRTDVQSADVPSDPLQQSSVSGSGLRLLALGLRRTALL